MLQLLVCLIFLAGSAYSSFPCSGATPYIIIPNSGPEFPANINDSYYGANTNCLYRILAEPGKYLQLSILTNISDTDSLVIKNDADLYIRYRSGDTTKTYSSPLDFQINLNAKSSGSFRILFYSMNYNNNLPTTRAIVPGGTGAFLQSQVIYNNPAIIKCNSSLAIQAQVINPTVQYMLYSSFIFAGEGTNGTYLGSLYSAYTGQYKVVNNLPYTVTIISVDPSDYGIALVKAYSDVVGYNVYLDYAYSSSIPQVPLDGTMNGKPAAITIFNQNENASDFYLAAADFSGLGKSGTAALYWQTGDLRPSSPIVTNYYANHTLRLLPQALSGRLNTLIAQNDIIRLGFTFDRPPQAFQHVPSGTTTYFTSKNFPYIGAQQGHVVTYSTDYLRARVTVYVRQYTANSGFSITYYQAGIANPTVKIMSPGDQVSFIANQIIFNYPQTTADAGCAAYVSIEDAGHISPGNSSTPTPGGGSTPKPKSSGSLGVSLLLLIISCLRIV